MKIIGEQNDTAPIINRHNIVIKTKWNGMRMMDNASFTDWNKIFIFPDHIKAEFFQANFKTSMHDYRDGMLKDDYIFHIINCMYPAPKEIYADQMEMSADYFTEILYYNHI